MADPTEAGWYTDPLDSSRLRRWDGEHWTNDVTASERVIPDPGHDEESKVESDAPLGLDTSAFEAIEPVRPPESAHRSTGSRNALSIVVAALVVILLAGGAFAMFGNTSSQSPPPTSQSGNKSAYDLKSAETQLSTATTDAQIAYSNGGNSFGANNDSVVTYIMNQENGMRVISAPTVGDTGFRGITVQWVSKDQVILGAYSPIQLNSGAGGCIYASINNASAVSSASVGGPPGTNYGVGAAGVGCQYLNGPPKSTWSLSLPR